MSTVIIDCFPESAQRYKEGYAVVAVDVIRATTTAVTAAAAGRRCFPVPTMDAAVFLAERLENPLLVGELGGNMPFGFHMTNSPAQIAARTDNDRPAILLSSSGTQLIHEAQDADATFLACFRNYRAVASYAVDRYEHIAVIGAGTRGEFREEDQMCCAWMVEILLNQGFEAKDARTVQLVKKWSGVSQAACYASKSVGYLQKTDQLEDLKFILSHVNDLDTTCMMVGGEVVEIPATPRMEKDKSPAVQNRNVEQITRP